MLLKLFYVDVHKIWQVREVIGVTLSVLCSNMRLFSISGHSHVQEEDMVESLQREAWAKTIIEAASASAVNIQSANQFETMETATDINHENGCATTESQPDVKRMETVSVILLLFKIVY